ncbi:3-hydroxy-3-methylglutaryl CoA synthase [Thermomonospora echinospora]|uniref:3-hydroxy-3-methylglutaryl CoA synthase n=1 Tax=Thermomonospora echinospora TaxID=1992 RepID=A0A1H5T8D3_9ACTN|nr:OB-fold domain-containing protein [Thermomonospora echinospora]SEF59024.1 3-hydroxy-3-methylglutaryl CoA synthase [Thermomonospora echinospora]
MRGILGWGGYLPHRRLDRSAIRPVAGTGGGAGTRTVASYDEDTTTMAVAAARHALRGAPARPRALWFATTEPAYLDKSNATAVHAALRLDRTVAAYDASGSVHSAMGALRAGLDGAGPALVVASDLRTGLPGGPDEAAGGDGAAALLVGSDHDAPVLAEPLAWTSLTEEFLDRWRTPGAPASRLWEERFGETRYTGLGLETLKLALDEAGTAPSDVSTLIVAGLHERAAKAVAARSGVPADRVADRLGAQAGNVGAAQPALLLADALERARPGQTVVLVTLSDGADAVVFRTTGALAAHRPGRTVAAQLASGVPVSYGTYLAWRGLLPVEPPRRPEPARPSAPAAGRNREWKFGFVGSRGDDGTVRLPPSPLDDARHPMADATGTIVTFTVDRLAYSPSPPVVFAVVDFDGGGRLPVELTDVDEGEVRIGGRVEMTFRRLFTAEGVHNYFWKARPVRDAEESG